MNNKFENKQNGSNLICILENENKTKFIHILNIYRNQEYFQICYEVMLQLSETFSNCRFSKKEKRKIMQEKKV